MRIFLLTLFALTFATASAEPVYRCIQNGKTVFTDEPVDPSCQKVQLNVYQPDPAEVARQEEQKRQAEQQERADREQAEKDRLLQTQTQAAQAQMQAAQAQRQWAEQQTQDRQMRDTLGGGYGYGWGYGGYPYGLGYGPWPDTGYPVTLPAPVPGYRPRPPYLPSSPTTPSYPYGADRMSPGR